MIIDAFTFRYSDFFGDVINIRQSVSLIEIQTDF